MINTTWNPNELSGGASLSYDLLTLNMTTHSQGSKSTIPREKGKFYFEVEINSISSNLDIGIADNTYTYNEDSTTSPNVVVTRESKVGTVGVAVNLDNNTVDFYKNGVFKESKIITSQLIGIEVFALVRSATSTGSRNVTGNFGATTFSYPIPTGFRAYNDIYFNKFLILPNDNIYKYYNGSSWVDIGLSATEQDFIDNGMDDLSVVPHSAWRELNGLVQVVHYTDNPTQEESDITVETEPYSVYDYISETPEVLVYNESEDDITVETTTEPFTIYDEFGEEVEVLHYTDDESVTETDLILEANYSPIDELEGDFEVVTWTDELEDTERVLEINGITTPKFIHQLEQVSIGELLKVLVNDNSETNIGKSNVRYLFSSDNTNWYSFKNDSFTRVNPINNDTIKVNGNTAIELLSIKEEQFKTWNFDKINVGVYLEDDVRDNITSKIGENVITHESYVDTPIITGNSLYILNTTALIDIELIGNSVFGTLSDEDMTRVQYRVKLNDQPYFPVDGEYTTLAESPQAISINFTSSEIKIDDWNNVVIEFRDYFGKEDSWSASFIGRYSGILFRDENGEDYSTDVGAILKYLDFGTVITGQYTPIYKVMLKNTYGFDVTDLKLEANTEGFPEGLVVEFSDNETFNDPVSSLVLGKLANDGEIPFYIRMNSPIDTQPNGANYFDIYVSAKRDV